MLYALALGNGAKIPVSGMDFVVKELIKQIAAQAGLKSITGSMIPAHLLFNYFTENAAKVSTHAISIFGGELLASKPKELPQTSEEEKIKIVEKFIEYLKHNEDLSMVYLKCYVLTKEERSTIISSLIDKFGDNPFLLEKLCNCFDKID